MLVNLGFARVSRCRMEPAAVALALLTATVATAQAPIVGPQVRIDVGGGTSAANETTASASEMDPNVIVAAWNDWRDAPPPEGNSPIRMGVARSFDGGQTWEDLLVRPPKGFQTNVEGDPMTAYDDRTGTLWVGAIAFFENVFVSRLDPGQTEFEPAVVTTAVGGGFDKGWMAAGPRLGEPDSTRVYIALSHGIQWSDDMGDTWTGFHSLGNGIGFLPRVGPNGELYVVHNSKLRRSLDNGQTFTTHTIAIPMDPWGIEGDHFPGRFRVPYLWYFDVSQQTGNLYVMYMDTTNIVNGQRNVDLYFTKSTDQGTTWTTPVVINGDNDPPGDQFFPWIELDGDDRIHVVFLDSRHTVQNDNALHGMFDAYYTYSDDDGATWNEFRLTPRSWDSYDDGLSWPNEQQFIGDYTGMAVAGNRVYPMYVDTSGGDPDIYTNMIVFPNVGDINGDGVVGAADLLILLVSWGPCKDCGDCPADLDGDCTVGASDLLILLANWG